MTTEWTTGTTVRRSGDVVFTTVSGQTMMMSIAKGRYYAVDTTGQRIWELTETPSMIGAIIDTLCDEFDVARDVCTEQTLEFMQEVHAQGLLDEVSTDATGAA